MKMALTEFIDVFGRIADKLNFDNQVVDEDLQELQAIKEEGVRVRIKRTGHLALKIEQFFKRLIVTVLGEQVKKEFVKSKVPQKRSTMKLTA